LWQCALVGTELFPVLSELGEVLSTPYDSYGMLVDPDNLAFGLYEEMELDQTTDTDKVHEDRLHSRNWLEGQFDFQVRNMQAGVLVKNIAAP